LRDCWDATKPPLLVIGLIPSTAGWNGVDRTVQRCREIAELNGYGELIVVNMFAIGPTPSHRRSAIALECLDAIEPANDRHIGKQGHAVRDRGGRIAVAWGNDGWSRHADVLTLLGYPDQEVWCFGTKKAKGKKPGEGWTADGFPRHASLRGVPPGAVELVLYPSPKEILKKL
jgi:hypothetical protein